MRHVVNDPKYDCEEFTLSQIHRTGPYTFMAADAFHKQIEDGMRRVKNVYDFPDFERIIQSKGIAVGRCCYHGHIGFPTI